MQRNAMLIVSLTCLLYASVQYCETTRYNYDAESSVVSIRSAGNSSSPTNGIVHRDLKRY
jgi:hypothetical protein